MSELSRESGTSRINLSVDDKSRSKSPAQVDVDNVLLTFYNSFHQLTICHRTGIVVNADRIIQFFAQDISQRAFFKIKGTETIAFFRIDTSGNINTNLKNLGLVNRCLINEVPDMTAKFFQPFRSILQMALYLHLQINHISREIHQTDIYTIRFDIHSHQISGIRIQTIQIRRSSFCTLLLSVTDQITGITHFGYELRNRRNA